MADSRRDSSLDDTDSFQIIIDTYLDKQNGFVFGDQPGGSGIRRSGDQRGSGQRPIRRWRSTSGGQQQRGSGGGFNLNWDGGVAGPNTNDRHRLSAEIAIPFRTLRYPTGEEQTWGINFQRNIRNRNETAFWRRCPVSSTCIVSRLPGEVQGLEVPVQRNLKLVPYMLGEAIRRAVDDTTTMLGDFGADLKYSVTPSLTLDLTYNTDFAAGG